MVDIQKFLRARVNSMRLDAASAQETLGVLGVEQETLLETLLILGAEHSRAPVSNFQVGAVGLGATGTYYLGTNVEIEGLPLSQTLHAEQFVLINARLAGEQELDLVATSAPPCGHCRQFLYEANTAMEIYANGSAQIIS